MKLKIELGGIATIETFHDTVAQKLKFPVFYGRNLDAFWDCLSEIDDRIEIEIVGLESVKEPLKSEVMQYVELLAEHQRGVKKQWR